VNELSIDPNHMISILNYDGMPITADFIMSEIKASLTVQAL
jgi:2-oxoglutarate ferredoxin oxidoreductase subunit alpha